MIIPPANAPVEMMPWVRSVNQSIRDNADAIARLTSDTNNNLKQLNGSVELLGNQIRALPQFGAASSTVNAINANSSSFVTKASTSVVVPANKTTAVVSVSGGLALLDTVSGGVAAPPIGRMLVNGALLPNITSGIPATKDSGAANVNNVLFIAGASTITVTPGSSITAEIQVQVFHLTAYAANSASNYATVALQITFT